MIYRRLGRTGFEVSRLGFGAMRLPQRDDDTHDVEESIRIIHRAFELGVNYIDTAVGYCASQSQPIVGEALRRWRKQHEGEDARRIYVSTKNHYYGPEERVWWRNLENSLERLGVDAIDVYNCHGINWKRWEEDVNVPDRVLSWMQKARDQGLIRHICTSFHDNAEGLSKIAATDAFSVITLQYNLLDRQLEEVFPELVERDIGIVVMGPVGGGRLGGASEALAGMVDGASSVPEIALRFVLDNEHVATTISGMSAMDQVEENCRVAACDEPLSDAERQRVAAALERFKGLAELYCTGCDYCMPCPSGVRIPANFSAVNLDRVYGLREAAEKAYNGMSGKATLCVACGACEPKCPQHIPIRAQLRETVRRFDADYGKMTVGLTPLKRDGDRVTLNVCCHNLSDAAKTATVRLATGDGQSAQPAELQVQVDEPFRVKREPVRVPVSELVCEPLRLQANVADASGERSEEAALALGPCYRAASIEDLCGRHQDLEPLSVEIGDQAIAVTDGKEADSPCVKIRAWAGYTSEEFLLCFETQDNTAVATRHLDVVVDLRNLAEERPPGFHNGMHIVHLNNENVASVPRGRLDAAQVTVNASQEGDLRTLRMTIPWEALAQDVDMEERGFEPGDGFGFDLAFGCRDASDRIIYGAVWSGNKRGGRDGRGGILFFVE